MSFLHRNTLLSFLLIPLGLAAAGAAQAATTYYVRADGGDANQCNGRGDAPYSGSGTGQACAWKHPFFALPPGGTPRIAGGDTLIIGGGSYMMGQGAPGSGSCGGSSCYMAPIPSGPSATSKTRILGQAGTTPVLWGAVNTSRIINLQDRSNIEVGNLEITDRSDCVYSHSQAVANCSLGMNYARVGVYASKSSNVWLHDMNIHGLAHMGMNTGALSNWLIERVRINKNGRAGWDGSVGGDLSSNSGSMVLRNVEVSWNGCGERWQTGETWACWAQQTGGYGDGIGTYYTGGQWLIEDSFIHHNTSDGLDLRYMDGADTTTVTVRRLYAVGNAGNQAKIRGNSLVENSVLVSNCAFFRGKFYMVEEDNCRAAGNTLQYVPTSGDTIVARHNTITGEGGVLIGANEGDSTNKISIENNVLIGFPRWDNAAMQSSAYYANNSLAQVSWAGNLLWKVKNDTCPTGSICGQDPKLANMTLAAFDATPLTDSPVVDKVGQLLDLATDFLMQPRPAGLKSDVGAYEVQPVVLPPPPPPPVCTRAAPTLTVAGPTVEVVPGTTNTYTLSLTNNDSPECANAGFALARTVPTGWTGTLSATNVTLAPGASTSATLAVTSAGTATAGNYGIGVGMSSAEGSVHTASASATYAVKVIEKIVATMTTSATTNKTTYTAGETVTMTSRVLVDGKPIKGASVKFDALKPNGVNHIILNATTDIYGYAKTSFKSGTGDSSIGTYKLRVDAASGTLTATANTSFAVNSPTTKTTTGLTGSVSTSQSTYTAGSTVYMTSRVLKNGVAVSNARVQFTALKPNGINTIITTAYTNSTGYAKSSFATGTGPSSIGTYKLSIEATSGTLKTTAATTFAVK
ncbi:NEW3 domain-containing protein [Lysobacter korlensis]|uniref:NEW3 domain-containing protein n=1 Tax=Lysobacter korlensis TaxID=553636 RepID=A0ABV6RRV4_9GAMM